MKELLFVSWNLHGLGGSKRALKSLERCDLRHLAHQEVGAASDPEGGFTILGSFGCVRLPRTDPRLKHLIKELRAAGEEPHTRVDRVYSAKERRSSIFVACCNSTTMVLAGQHRKQQWDMSDACPTCGAGAVPVPPLIVRFESKNKSGWAVTCPMGLIVVSKSVAARLTSENLSGFKLHPIRTPRSKAPDKEWRWLCITCTWPRYSKRTIMTIDEPCADCDRPGRFGSMEGPCEIHYKAVPKGAKDFNLTNEQWGYYRKRDGSAPRGAAPLTILSHRAYSVLLDEGVKLPGVEPVFIDGK